MVAKITRTLILTILMLQAGALYCEDSPAVTGAAATPVIAADSPATAATPTTAATPAASDTVLLEQSQAEGSSVGYYFDTDADGNSVFTQVLSWDVDPYALRFEVVIRDSGETEILRKTTEGSSIKVQLVPGSYTYNIITWNLLDQPEIESGWMPLIVIKAELPENHKRHTRLYLHG